MYITILIYINKHKKCLKQHKCLVEYKVNGTKDYI